MRQQKGLVFVEDVPFEEDVPCDFKIICLAFKSTRAMLFSTAATPIIGTHVCLRDTRTMPLLPTFRVFQMKMKTATFLN